HTPKAPATSEQICGWENGVVAWWGERSQKPEARIASPAIPRSGFWLPASFSPPGCDPIFREDVAMIFLNTQHELRSGWKFAIYIAFFLFLCVITGIALSMVITRSASDITQNQLVLLALNEVALFVPAAA